MTDRQRAIPALSRLPTSTRRAGDRLRMSQAILIAATLVGFTLFASVGAADSRHERLAKGETLTFSSPVKGSDVPRVGIDFVVDIAPATMWKIIDECGSYHRTMPRIYKSREIARKGSVVTCETWVDMPFPISNLHAVSRAIHTKSATRFSRAWDLVEGTYVHNKGSWELTPFDEAGKRTLVVYRIHAVPDSAVPDSLIRLAQTRTLPSLAVRMREEAAKLAGSSPR